MTADPCAPWHRAGHRPRPAGAQPVAGQRRSPAERSPRPAAGDVEVLGGHGPIWLRAKRASIPHPNWSSIWCRTPPATPTPTTWLSGHRRPASPQTDRDGAPERVELPDPLTDAEIRVLEKLPQRLSYADIAAELHLSLNTVKTHLRHTDMKLGVSSRSAAVRRAASARFSLTVGAGAGRADQLPGKTVPPAPCRMRSMLAMVSPYPFWVKPGSANAIVLAPFSTSAAGNGTANVTMPEPSSAAFGTVTGALPLSDTWIGPPPAHGEPVNTTRAPVALAVVTP